MSRDAKALSLGFELDSVRTAFEAALVLAEALREDQLDEDQRQRVPALLVAQLAVVVGRLRQVGRVIRREVDPAEVIDRQNQTTLAPSEHDDPDIRLGVWSDGERAEHAREVLRRAGLAATRGRKGRKR